jgi:iron complex transport system substrate-binding protein
VNTRRFFLGLVALSMLLAACGPMAVPTVTAIPPTATPTQPTAPFPVTLTDDANRQVTIKAEPKRIVSLAPSNTEIAFALGLGSKVIGVTDFCDYPPEAKSIPKIGGLEPNLEKVVSLNPDLVLSIGGELFPSEQINKMERLNLTVLVLYPKTLDGIFADIELVGRATGISAQAKDLVAKMRAHVDAVTAKTQNVATKPKVFYELDATDPSKPYTSGPNTWHDQLITLAGGVNVAGTAKVQWAQFSTEEILKQQPDLIILGDAMFGITIDSVKKRPGWSSLTAVKSDAIYPIDDNLISRPGPRVVDGLETLAKIIHPELFK